MPHREVLRLLDTESVRPFQVVVYYGYFGAGVQALWTGEVPNAVGQILGRTAHLGWVALLIACPLLTYLGMRLERRHPAGLWLQIAGGCGIAAASATYVLALAQTAYAGQATFALWVVLALMFCAIAIVARDIRKLRAVTLAVRRTAGE